jgi:protein-ribulosamine 3-kinase
VLPHGTRVLWSATHGASFWAITTKIDTEDANGKPKSYFMKVYITAKGQAQAIGEYESTKALNSVIPDNVPKPIGLGVLARDASKHFLVVEFKDMIEEMPPVQELVAVLAKLHNNSISPDGLFGFTSPTSQSLQLTNDWCKTWEEFFTRAFKGTVELEQKIQGHNEELQRLADLVCAKVIPRLIRPMETGGRKVKPCLVHGDLWHGNLGIDLITDQVIFFDCCSFYGHNECTYAMMKR